MSSGFIFFKIFKLLIFLKKCFQEKIPTFLVSKQNFHAIFKVSRVFFNNISPQCKWNFSKKVWFFDFFKEFFFPWLKFFFLRKNIFRIFFSRIVIAVLKVLWNRLFARSEIFLTTLVWFPNFQKNYVFFLYHLSKFFLNA